MRERAELEELIADLTQLREDYQSQNHVVVAIDNLIDNLNILFMVYDYEAARNLFFRIRDNLSNGNIVGANSSGNFYRLCEDLVTVARGFSLSNEVTDEDTLSINNSQLLNTLQSTLGDHEFHHINAETYNIVSPSGSQDSIGYFIDHSF